MQHASMHSQSHSGLSTQPMISNDKIKTTLRARDRDQREAWNSTLTQIHARALALVPADKQAQLAVDIANITAWAAKVTGVPDETNNW